MVGSTTFTHRCRSAPRRLQRATGAPPRVAPRAVGRARHLYAAAGQHRRRRPPGRPGGLAGHLFWRQRHRLVLQCRPQRHLGLGARQRLHGGRALAARLECVALRWRPRLRPPKVRRLDALLRGCARRRVYTRRGARTATVAGGPLLELCARRVARAATALAWPRRPALAARRARCARALPPESRACSGARRWAKLRTAPQHGDR